jgi:hypothetical protein
MAFQKGIKDNSDSFNLVKPLEPRLLVSPKWEKYVCDSEGVLFGKGIKSFINYDLLHCNQKAAPTLILEHYVAFII